MKSLMSLRKSLIKEKDILRKRSDALTVELTEIGNRLKDFTRKIDILTNIIDQLNNDFYMPELQQADTDTDKDYITPDMTQASTTYLTEYARVRQALSINPKTITQIAEETSIKNNNNVSVALTALKRQGIAVRRGSGLWAKAAAAE